MCRRTKAGKPNGKRSASRTGEQGGGVPICWGRADDAAATCYALMRSHGCREKGAADRRGEKTGRGSELPAGNRVVCAAASTACRCVRAGRSLNGQGHTACRAGLRMRWPRRRIPNCRHVQDQPDREPVRHGLKGQGGAMPRTHRAHGCDDGLPSASFCLRRVRMAFRFCMRFLAV